MNKYPDNRDGFVHFIEIFSPMMKPGDESILRSISANSYSTDFSTLMNVLNGNVFASTITSKTIENAANIINKSIKRY